MASGASLPVSNLLTLLLEGLSDDGGATPPSPASGTSAWDSEKKEELVLARPVVSISDELRVVQLQLQWTLSYPSPFFRNLLAKS